MTATIQRFPPDEAKCAAQAVVEDGCVILEGAIPVAPLAALRRRMDRDTVDLLRFCATIGGNPRERGHLQQGPPPFADYVFGDVAMNRYVNALAQALFGGRPQLTFYNGNTNCPGSVRQRLHMDGRHSTAPGEPAAPTSAVVVNIPPGGMDGGNGAIELWPGSHRVTVHGEQQGVPPDMEAQRRGTRAPENPRAVPGDVLIRDVRLWHRGVPNNATRPRHMIALILSAPRDDERSGRTLRFGRGCEGALEGRGVDTNAAYVDEPVDYLFGPTKRIYRHRLNAKGRAA
ncbi:MAG: phytanoyl-CoA dioxygenase family protein [Gammaproteobacteria bacterium]|nr:phytanoyl-CoA dioxygenase family protein [Gammaproteobacteria bacterium]